MAGSLTVAMRAAQSGLLSTQSAVDATAKNIANSNTDGYSRKQVNFETRVLAGAGAGVQLTAFTRAVDEGLIKDLRRELTELNTLTSQDTYFQRVQSLFGAPGDNNSISHIISEFDQAAETLALSPDKTLEQNQFVRFASEIGMKLQSMSQEIQSLRAQADEQIEDTITSINTLTETIASTSDKIIRNQAVGNDVTDLQDQRDNAITELSKLIDITYFPRSDGDLVIFTKNGFPLVDRTSNTFTHDAGGALSSSLSYAAGNITGIYSGVVKPDNDVTERVSGGKLAGLIDQRDNVLPNLQNQLDELASELRDSINLLHNRGVAFPGVQSMDGTRQFIDADAQTITLDPTNSAADVTISVFDSLGVQQATTTLNTIMTSGSYGTGTQADHGPWTVAEVADSIQDWYQANGASTATVAVSTAGNLDIDLNTTGLYTAFRDETATAENSTAADAEIGFDSDGDGDVDETAYGFANFFGLNDLYVDSSNGNLHESAQLSDSFSSSAATLTFYDSAAGVGSGNELGSVTFTERSSLSDMAEAINDADIGISAVVIPDGSGSRLRIQNDAGRETVITQGSGETMIENMGIGESATRSASTLAVRSDILDTPARSTTALMQFDTSRGKYVITAGDNTVIQQIAETLSDTNDFDATGGLPTTPKSFQAYAADILSRNAILADTNESQLETQVGLTESLKLEADRISGVNLDEEMANLILFQQAFSASARVISVIQEMFKTLEDAF